MIATLLGITLALPPSGDSHRLTVDASVQLDARTLDTSYPPAPAPPSGRWIGGSAGFGISVFGRRVVDDDAAPTLQPFLQRTSRFRLEGGGGGADIHYPFNYAGVLYESTLTNGQAAISAEGYAGRWIYLGAGFRVDYQRWHEAGTPGVLGGFDPTNPLSPTVIQNFDSSELILHPAATIGVRWRDLLAYVGWGLAPYHIGGGSFHVQFWGGAYVGARAVVRRFVDLGLRIDVLDGGALVDGSVTVWLRRRFGIGAGLDGGHGGYVDSSERFDRVGGHVGLTWWFSPRIAASLAYAPAWQRTTPVGGLGTAVSDFSWVKHLVTLSISGRPPTKR